MVSELGKTWLSPEYGKKVQIETRLPDFDGA